MKKKQTFLIILACLVTIVSLKQYLTKYECREQGCPNPRMGASEYCRTHTPGESETVTFYRNTKHYIPLVDENSKYSCITSGCGYLKTGTSDYCKKHKCCYKKCRYGAIEGTHYCYQHMPSSMKSTYSGSSSSSRRSDPYDVYDYSDGDEFADEWESEFGDWDDAWDYYEENR